ncbi:MAG: hypothetical protein RSF01_09395 [Bacteroidales bacterium]
MGRKNWLQAGSTASAIRATMMYSFIGTCKAFDVNPTEWFRYVIDTSIIRKCTYWYVLVPICRD